MPFDLARFSQLGISPHRFKGGIAMKRWFIGCLVGMVAGIGAYLLVSQKQLPPVEKDLGPPTAGAPTEPTVPSPVVLAQVIEMADIDPLLDPPAKLPTGAPFDEEAASTPATAPTKPTVPDHIPPAVEDASEISELSYQPKGTLEAIPLNWYGSGRLPRQLALTPLEIHKIEHQIFYEIFFPNSYLSLQSFKLSNLVFSALWVENVPDTVLMKLAHLENKALAREDFVTEITSALTSDEKEKYLDTILNHAQMITSGFGGMGVFGGPN
jgi:hypothetical protein